MAIKQIPCGYVFCERPFHTPVAKNVVMHHLLSALAVHQLMFCSLFLPKARCTMRQQPHNIFWTILQQIWATQTQGHKIPICLGVSPSKNDMLQHGAYWQNHPKHSADKKPRETCKSIRDYREVRLFWQQSPWICAYNAGCMPAVSGILDKRGVLDEWRWMRRCSDQGNWGNNGANSQDIERQNLWGFGGILKLNSHAWWHDSMAAHLLTSMKYPHLLGAFLSMRFENYYEKLSYTQTLLQSWSMSLLGFAGRLRW